MNNGKNNLPEIVRTKENWGLSGLQIQAAELLLHEPKVSDVASRLGVTRQTLYNWLKDSKFSVYLAQKEAELLQSATRRMIRLVDDSTVLLDQALKGEIELTSDQKFSIELVSKRAPRLLDTALVHTRLASLQAKLEQLEGLQ